MHPTVPDSPFRHADLPRLGLTRRTLQRLEAQGDVRRVVRGVYCRSDLPDDVLHRVLAARLVLPPGMVVCDHSAAWLHGISAASTPTRLDVASPPDGTASLARGMHGCTRSLSVDDVVVLHGIPVTTPLRTAADLACRWGRNDAIAVLDEFRRVHELTHADYARVTARFAGRRGVTQLRELGPRAITQAESPPESWTRLAIIDANLPEPEPQPEVYIEGYGWVRPDLAYVLLKIAIEYDGVEFHTSDEDREHDRVRRRAMVDAGWVVIVVRKDGFSEPGLSTWLHDLRTSWQERAEPKRRYARGEINQPFRRRRRA